MTSTPGWPKFKATITGITDENPYFYLDFHADHTIVWDTGCTTNGIGLYLPAPCSQEPTNMNLGFDGSTLPSVGTFDEAVFGGYVASGI